MKPFALAPQLDAFPISHGKAPFAMAVRKLLWENHYSALALAFPRDLEQAAVEAVEHLPHLHAVAVWRDGELVAYMPADPCDAFVEGMRQARQRRMEIRFLEADYLLREPQRLTLPDANLLTSLGAEKYLETVRQVEGIRSTPFLEERTKQVFETFQRKLPPHKTLLLCDFSLYFALEKRFEEERRKEIDLTSLVEPQAEYLSDQKAVATAVYPIKPSQLYFALGELPHYAGEIEKERRNPLAEPRPYFDLVKSLFIATRTLMLKNKKETRAVAIKKIQTALTFARNLAALDQRLTPGLLDLVAAARGVFGHAFAASLLEAARAYPFSPQDVDENPAWMEIGREAIRVPGWNPTPAFNLFEDEPKIWKSIHLRREPDKKRQANFRAEWDQRGLCSHVPEDIRIERFNRNARAKSRDLVQQGQSRSEPLTSSIKDGIDARETLRNFAFSGRVHVREIPPQRGKVDTVVVLFDDANDPRYTFRMAWAFEHEDESMFTFYATQPMAKMAGPGIAEAEFGGFSLLFPPRTVPDVFKLPAAEFGFQNLAEQLLYGALSNSAHKFITVVSAQRPGLRLRRMAAGFKKRLAWVPLTAFGAETISRLRLFHVLNGKDVRAWATRFIQD